MASAGLTALVQGTAAGLGAALKSFSNTSARAAAKANGVSAASQAAQGTFNQASANNANSINADSILNQYGFNSGQAQAANNYTSAMWDKAASYNTDMWNMAAAWNEKMFNKQMEFNAEQAKINRDWQEKMSNTQYQRAISDLEKAGLNPILAATGGMTAGYGSGSAASASSPSLSGASMSGASGAMASGGLLGANTASEGNYTGQMEYMAGSLGLISAALQGLSSGLSAMSAAGMNGNQFVDFVKELLLGPNTNVKDEVERYEKHTSYPQKIGSQKGKYWDRIDKYTK